MKTTRDDLDAAAGAAAASRARLIDRLSFARRRLTPSRLSGDAKDFASEKAEDAARALLDQGKKHPVMLGLGLTGSALWVLRDRLMPYAPKKVQTLYDWLAGNLPFSATMEQQDGDGVESSD